MVFNKDFYPTKQETTTNLIGLIRTELLQLNLDTHKILEPSAGKGNIIDFLQEEDLGVYPEDVVCIEIHPDLCGILREKNYPTMNTDFLLWNPSYNNLKIGAVIMNPPFSQGVKHLLKAWEIVDNGGVVACLLNKRNFERNFDDKYIKAAKKLIEDYGEIHDFGQCFLDAENKTNVDVIAIKLTKPATRNIYEGMFDGLEMHNTIEFDGFESIDQLAKADYLDSLINAYDDTLRKGIEFMKIGRLMNYYGSTLLPKRTYISDMMKHLTTSTESGFDQFKKEFNAGVWDRIFNEVKIGKYMTKKVKDEFNELREGKQSAPFTRANIQEVIEIIFSNREKIFTDSCVEAFDLITKYYEDNRYYPEGWKTNKQWKVGKKFIHPRFIYRWGIGSTYLDVNSNYTQEMNDIDRVMCMLSGMDWDDPELITIRTALYNALDALGSDITKVRLTKENSIIESTFFKMRFYKKGTVHFHFKDEHLWAKFNQVACGGKNWLGK